MTSNKERIEARLKVEAALSQATRANPISAEQIAIDTGVSVTLVRTHLGTCVSQGMAHNLRAGKPGKGLYAAGKAPPPKPLDNMPAPRTAVEFVPLKLKPWNPPRAESLDAFKIPSLHCGQQIERKRPAIIAGKAMQAVGMHGGVL